MVLTVVRISTNICHPFDSVVDVLVGLKKFYPETIHSVLLVHQHRNVCLH